MTNDERLDYFSITMGGLSGGTSRGPSVFSGPFDEQEANNIQPIAKARTPANILIENSFRLEHFTVVF